MKKQLSISNLELDKIEASSRSDSNPETPREPYKKWLRKGKRFVRHGMQTEEQ